jgi:uncharacterized protein (UPF0548 family)
MLSLQKPSVALIRNFLADESGRPNISSTVGAAKRKLTGGYVVDHSRIKLGEGEAVFHAASAALQRWEQFRLGWVEAWSPSNSIRSGQVVAVMARVMGL